MENPWVTLLCGRVRATVRSVGGPVGEAQSGDGAVVLSQVLNQPNRTGAAEREEVLPL